VDGDFDGKKHTLAAELLPSSLQFGGVPFTLGSSAPGAMNVLVPKGQKLTVPAGSFDRLYLLAAAVGGDATTTIDVGSVRQALTVREWEGAIGQWDSPLKDTSALREPFVPSRPSGVPTSAEIRAGMIIPWDPQTFTVNPADIDLIRRGFVKRDDIAWVGTHRHAPDGNQTYIKSYVFAYAIDLPVGTRTVTLPNDDRVRILAATVVSERSHVRPASVLYAPDLGEPAVAPVSRTASIR
jgi:alpha-mannosidase